MKMRGEISGNSVIGEVDAWNVGNRDGGGGNYTSLMKRARVIVTANPGHWEGDFRLWEALSSKALVMCDYLYVPIPHMLRDGHDLIFFDYRDQQGFENKVREEECVPLH